MMKDDNIIVDTDPMNPLCFIYTFKEANKWYYNKKEAEEDYKKYIKDKAAK